MPYGTKYVSFTEMESESYQKKGVQQTTSESEIFELLAFLKGESTVDTNDVINTINYYYI